MNHTRLQELAAANALGALDAAGLAELEAAIANDPAAKSVVASFLDAAAALAVALSPPRQPPPALREKILQRIAGHPRPTKAEQPAHSPAGFKFVLEAHSIWQPGPIPGIRVKPLSVSADMGYHVLLAEIGPGVVYPEHEHTSSEDLYILSGHLQTEGRLLGPGDFLHAEPGTHHHQLFSPDGCVALLIERAPAAS